MSKSKKTPPAPPTPAAPHDTKGFLVLAGEAFAVLGEEIVEGKDKVVEVAGKKITALKTAISNITHKKKAPAKKVAKKAPAKKVPAKKAPAKKVVRKAPPKKAAKKLTKKAPPKKAAKKKK